MRSSAGWRSSLLSPRGSLCGSSSAARRRRHALLKIAPMRWRMRMHAGERRTRCWQGLCLAVLLSLSGCVVVVPAGSPPPCPEWGDEALGELEAMQATGLYPDVEQELGRALVHCEGLDEMREPRIESP